MREEAGTASDSGMAGGRRTTTPLTSTPAGEAMAEGGRCRAGRGHDRDPAARTGGARTGELGNGPAEGA
ncbi:hypothetical protein GCM10010421_42190 [Streptomyces glaucus]|uniref:Uncharacterized protein n=1 Tax=Streptomyces glaucus TaxID=284029 RepID=A0ABN3K4H6_9ACTN